MENIVKFVTLLWLHTALSVSSERDYIYLHSVKRVMFLLPTRAGGNGRPQPTGPDWTHSNELITLDSRAAYSQLRPVYLTA